MTLHIIQEIAQTITDWEKQIEWLAQGWDCLDEYQHHVSYRAELEILLDHIKKADALPDALRQRITGADDRFRSLTVETGLCVWHTGPQFRHFDGHIELTFQEYDPKKYWFFYRWLPGNPYSIDGHDSLSYQKAMYGLDFRNMSKQELIDAALVQVARFDKLLSDSVRIKR